MSIDNDDIRTREFARQRTDSLVKKLSPVAGVLVALCISLAVRLETGYPPGIEPKPFAQLLGMPAPGFDVSTLNGEIVSLEQLYGELSAQKNGPGAWLLFFTNTSCGACDATYPSLKTASKQLPVLVVGIGSRDLLAQKITQHGIAARAGCDSLKTINGMYGVRTFPSTLLLDSAGVVLSAATGVGGVDQLVAEWKSMQENAL